MIFSWENGRQLASMTKGNKTTSYTYDISGMRTQKNVDGTVTKYYYDDNNNLVSMVVGDKKLMFYYDQNGSISSVLYGGTRYYYVKNLQGDITMLVDENGSVAARYTYDHQGALASVKDNSGTVITSADHIANLNPLRYRGYVYDTDSGLYYLQSRYYDPDTGRFINADVYCDTGNSVLSTNMFAYCENNPVKGIDDDGKKTSYPILPPETPILLFRLYKYNRQKAVNYAMKWWNSRNRKFYSYSQDCTNFVSQCLYAGGIPMLYNKKVGAWCSYKMQDTKWMSNPLAWAVEQYRYKWIVSDSWRLCNESYKFFKKASCAKKVITIKDTRSSVTSAIKYLKVGDPMYMDDNGDGKPNHAVIITKVDTKKKKIYYAGHTSNRKTMDLESYLSHKSRSKKKVYAIALKDSFRGFP